MALPVTISGATYPKQNSFCGPFKSSGGNFYIVAFDTTSAHPAVYKATDPTSSFSEQDGANRPATSTGGTLGNYVLAVGQNGDTLLLVTEADGSIGLRFSDFSMSTDAWGRKNIVICTDPLFLTSHSADPIIVRSDGSFIAFGVKARDFLMGTNFGRVGYYKSVDSGATWAAGVEVDGQAGLKVQCFGSRSVLGASDRSHFFFCEGTTAKHRSLSSADDLGTNETPTSANAVTASEHNFIHGISYVSGANTVVKTAYLASGTDKLDSIEFNSAATGAALGTAAFTDNTIFDNGTTTPASVHGCLAVDGTTVHCLYADQTGQDVYHDYQLDGGAWHTDVLELAATINALSCNIFDRDGQKKLAFVYDDGGTVKYNEIALGPFPLPRTRCNRAVTRAHYQIASLVRSPAITRNRRTRMIKV